MDSLPEATSKRLANNDLSFQYQAESFGNVIQINAVFAINKREFLPFRLAEIRTFYDEMISSYGQQIVLKKISR